MNYLEQPIILVWLLKAKKGSNPEKIVILVSKEVEFYSVANISKIRQNLLWENFYAHLLKIYNEVFDYL